MKTEVHGQARLSECGKFLTITTMAKRGKKMVPNVQTYLVEDVRPDVRVANPAYSLTKGTIETSMMTFDENGEPVEDYQFVPSGEVWHVSYREFGVECDCPWRNYNPNSPICKHGKAMQAVGLLPKGSS